MGLNAMASATGPGLVSALGAGFGSANAAPGAGAQESRVSITTAGASGGAVAGPATWGVNAVAALQAAGVWGDSNLSALWSGAAQGVGNNDFHTSMMGTGQQLLDRLQTGSEGSSRGSPLDEAVARVMEELEQNDQQEQQVLTGSFVLSTGFSVGYVIWLARGGVLLASLASSVPAWASIDPLPVLSRLKGKDDPGPARAKKDAKPDAAEGLGTDAEKTGVSHPNADGHDAVENLFQKAPPRAVPGSALAKPARPETLAMPEVSP
jgi:hypothetical protein